MAKWSWQGIDKDGKTSSGVVDAVNQKDARLTLRAKGIKLRKLDPPSILEFDITEWLVQQGLAKSFGSKELMLFTRQLSVMLDAGVPMMQSLEILFKSEKNPSLKASIRRIAADVKEGKTLHESMEKQEGFDRLYCNLVKAGESSGTLDSILDKLTKHMEKVEKLKTQVKSAMTYPAVVSCIGAGVIWLMMVFVVPQFVDMLEDTGQEPPTITKMIIGASDFFNSYTIILLPLFVLSLVFLKIYTRTQAGKSLYDRVIMNTLIFGEILVKGELASFCRTLATLLSAGVPLIDAFDICIETVANKVIVRDLKNMRMSVERGKNLAQSIIRIDYFPEMLGQMIKVGEQTGRLDSMLEKVSDILEEEVSTLVNTMTKLIEPLVIVILGGIVSFILVGMYLPIFMAAGGGME